MSNQAHLSGLLNAIALNETRAVPRPSRLDRDDSRTKVREVLRTVAAREGEHGLSFAERINELGLQVQEKDYQGLEERVPLASVSRHSDIDKSERFGLHELEKILCYFDDVFRIIRSTSAPGSSSDATLRRSTTAAAYS